MRDSILISRESLFSIAWKEKIHLNPSQGVPEALLDLVLGSYIERVESIGTLEEVANAAIDLVFTTESTCINHCNTDIHSSQHHVGGVLLGEPVPPLLINYHNASSEGDFKIVYQDTVAKDRSYLCLGAYIAGIDGNTTFYDEDVSFAGKPGKYMDAPQNPLKVADYWYLFGNSAVPGSIWQVLIDKGLTFSDLTRDVAERIGIEQELDSLDIEWPLTDFSSSR